MWWRWLGLGLAVLVLFLLIKAYPWWWGGRAEILDTPFPAQLTDVRAPHHRHCDTNGCWVRFDVRVTNPTDRDAQVAQCSVSLPAGPGQTRDVPWVVPGDPGGRFVAAGSSFRLSELSAPLVVSYADLAHLPAVLEGTCEGWDWHGHAPI